MIRSWKQIYSSDDDDTKMAQMVCSIANREEYCMACGS